MLDAGARPSQNDWNCYGWAKGSVSVAVTTVVVTIVSYVEHKLLVWIRSRNCFGCCFHSFFLASYWFVSMFTSCMRVALRLWHIKYMVGRRIPGISRAFSAKSRIGNPVCRTVLLQISQCEGREGKRLLIPPTVISIRYTYTIYTLIHSHLQYRK